MPRTASEVQRVSVFQQISHTQPSGRIRVRAAHIAFEKCVALPYQYLWEGNLLVCRRRCILVRRGEGILILRQDA